MIAVDVACTGGGATPQQGSLKIYVNFHKLL